MLDIKFETKRLFTEPMKNEDIDFIFQILNTEGWKKILATEK